MATIASCAGTGAGFIDLACVRGFAAGRPG